MRTECVDPRYELNPNQTHWIYSADDVRSLLEFIERGENDEAKRVLQDHKRCQSV